MLSVLDLKLACEPTRGKFSDLHEWHMIVYRGCNSNVLDRFMVMFVELLSDGAFLLTLLAFHISHVSGEGIGSVSWYTCLFVLSI